MFQIRVTRLKTLKNRFKYKYDTFCCKVRKKQNNTNKKKVEIKETKIKLNILLILTICKEKLKVK